MSNTKLDEHVFVPTVHQALTAYKRVFSPYYAPGTEWLQTCVQFLLCARHYTGYQMPSEKAEVSLCSDLSHLGSERGRQTRNFMKRALVAKTMGTGCWKTWITSQKSEVDE